MNVLNYIFGKKSIHQYYNALIRLTKVSTEVASNTPRGRICAYFVLSVINKKDIFLPEGANNTLEQSDFEYISVVMRYLKDIQTNQNVTEMYKLLVDKIEKEYPERKVA